MNTSFSAPCNPTVTGLLYSPEGREISQRKFHLYDQENRFLAAGKTNTLGRFIVQLPASFPLGTRTALIFRICSEEKLISDHPDIKENERLAKDFAFYKERRECGEGRVLTEISSAGTNLGEIKMEEFYTEEKVPLSYQIDIVKAVLPATFTSFKEGLKEKFDFFDWHGVAEVQQAYAVPPIPLTAENTWKLLTNGVCPIYFHQSGNLLTAKVNWDRYTFDKLKSLPNVSVVFEKGDAAVPTLKSIEVQFRKTLEPSFSKKGKVVYLPGDENFKEGLRIANSAFHVYGQTTYHLAMGHVYGSMVSQCAHDFLQGTKLGELILPHCKFIRKISNELGKAAIFGEEGVLNVSALSVKGIAQLIDDTLAAHDPFSFHPRTPIDENHLFAKAQNLHYDVVRESVADFFAQHWEEIAADWGKIHHFFEKMHRASPPYRPWNGLSFTEETLHGSTEIGAKPHPDAPQRAEYKGQLKSIRPVACNPEGPEKTDREMIALFFTDFIHHVTLWHSWIHRSQYLETPAAPHTMDLNFSPITINDYGRGPFGGITEEEANKQLRIERIFQGFPAKNYTLAGAEHVHPGLVKRVLAVKDRYLACGIDPENDIHVSTVI